MEDVIQVMNVAAAEVDGKELLFLSHPDHSEWSRLAQVSQENTQQQTIVKSLTLDSLLESSGWNSSIPLFVKMDIEGGEPNAIAGIRQSLSKAKNYFVIVEFHVALLDQIPDGAMKFARDLLALNTTFLCELNESKGCLVRIQDEESFQAWVNRCRAGKQLSEIMTNIVFGTQDLSDLASPSPECG